MTLRLMFALLSCALMLSACNTATGDAATQATPSTSNSVDANKAANANPQKDVARTARDPLVNAAPLGFELGYATVDGVRAALKGRATLKSIGTNKFIGGPMFQADVSDLGSEGLKDASFIFDKNNILASVVLTMREDTSVDEMAELLGEKYQLVSNDYDSSTGDETFRFEQGNSRVDLNVPRRLSETLVVYQTHEFDAAVKAVHSQAAQAKEDRIKALL